MQGLKQNTLELLVGASVLVIAAFFFLYMYQHNNSDDVNFISYSADFDRVDGLVEGADVRMSGVTVGAIKKLAIQPDTYMANVTFSVDPKIKLPKDSSAEVVSDGLLGGKYLALVPGGEEKFIDPGGTVMHTQSSVNLESMIGQLIFSNKADKKNKS